MTRFMQEITGEIDRLVQKNDGSTHPNYWKEHAEREMAKAVSSIEQMNIDENGVATWKSNGNCPMDDLLEMLEYAGITSINYENTRKIRDEQNNKFIKNYKEKMKNHVSKKEELFEMRAAFGSETTIVNILTGQTYKL